MSQLSDRIRKQFRESDDLRDAGLATPPEIRRQDDIRYGEDPAWQVLDVYRPAASEGKALPVIVSLHGGGWVYGDKERYQYYCMDLAKRGFAVVNFTYRLAPEFRFPAPLEDAALVFRWAADHAEEYGFDMRNLFAVGDSAGAHLLAQYACVRVNPEYAAHFSLPDGPLPRAVGLHCGTYEIGLSGSGVTPLLMTDYLPNRGLTKARRLMNLYPFITDRFPPAFLMTANDDIFKAQALKLSRRLTEQDVPFMFRLYGSREHRLAHVFHCDIRTPDARLCNDETCAFFFGQMERESKEP